MDATARLEQLIRQAEGRVRLAAQDPASRADVRLRRSVAIKRGGRWVDPGLQLIREGHAVLLAGTTEDAWNAAYGRAAPARSRTSRSTSG